MLLKMGHVKVMNCHVRFRTEIRLLSYPKNDVNDASMKDDGDDDENPHREDVSQTALFDDDDGDDDFEWSGGDGGG